MHDILVADVMTRNPITITPKYNLLECTKVMVKKRVGGVPIIDKEENLVGFIARRDILWAIIKKSKEALDKINVMDISRRKIAVINPSATLQQTYEKMQNTKFTTLPVILKNKLVGIITAKDILNFNPELYPEWDEFKQIKEESEKLKRIEKARKGRDIIEGICEECGKSDLLIKVGGILLCEDCRNKMI
jgi:CBS domain-containing protein